MTSYGDGRSWDLSSQRVGLGTKNEMAVDGKNKSHLTLVGFTRANTPQSSNLLLGLYAN
jgi:hypothetical protein